MEQMAVFVCYFVSERVGGFNGNTDKTRLLDAGLLSVCLYVWALSARSDERRGSLAGVK